MIIFLRTLFVIILLSMFWVTGWASLQCKLFSVPREVYSHPWFIATLFDTYWGFVTFFIWVCFKQTSLMARLLWFFAIILLGNIAMSLYCLRELFGVPATASVSTVLTLKRPGHDILAGALAIFGLAILIFA